MKTTITKLIYHNYYFVAIILRIISYWSEKQNFTSISKKKKHSYLKGFGQEHSPLSS